MGDAVFPRKPYDEVESEFIRGEVTRGSFDDLEYRRYVNELVWLEWYTNDWSASNATGLSAFGVTVHRWRFAAKFPEKNDIIRRQLGALTRSDDQWDVPAPGVSGKFLEKTHRHAAGWAAVQNDEQLAPNHRSGPEVGAELETPDFLFPAFPYPASQSELIREEICSGSFEDTEHRQWVNQLLWLEWFTIDPPNGNSFGALVKNLKLAALHPEEYDTVRRELGEETRDAMTLSGDVYYGYDDIEAANRRYRRAWQAVD